MLTREELETLERILRDRRVLSVYCPNTAHDPAHRADWRIALTHALHAVSQAWSDAPHAEREALHAATGHVTSRLEQIPDGLHFEGWAAFATEDGVQHATFLEVPAPLLVTWSDGVRLGPYVATLPRHTVAAIAIVDAVDAELYAWRDGDLRRVDALHARRHDAPVLHMGDPPRAGFHAGTRGAPGTDRAARARRIARAGLLRRVAEELDRIAGDHGWILTGGIPEEARAVISRLPASTQHRARALAGLDVHATEPQIRTRVRDAIATLQEDVDTALVDELVAHYADGASVSAGAPATLDALRVGAVDRMLMTPRFLTGHVDAAERAVRAAFASDAEIACVAGEAAEHLDRGAAGIAAHLRYLPSHWTHA